MFSHDLPAMVDWFVSRSMNPEGPIIKLLNFNSYLIALEIFTWPKIDKLNPRLLGLVKDRLEVIRCKPWKMECNHLSKKKQMKDVVPGKSEKYFQLFLWSRRSPHSSVTLSWIKWGKKFPFFLIVIWIGFLSFSIGKFYTHMCWQYAMY